MRTGIAKRGESRIAVAAKPRIPDGILHRVARAVGRNVRRKDADAKVTGAAKYIDDLSFPGMLHGRTIRSTIPRGRINAIRLDFDPAGFTVVDYRDIPGRNIVALIDDDQPCLAEHEVYHVAEPILLLAHADRERLSPATCRIDYTPQPALFDPERSTRSFKNIAIDKGSIDEGFAQADVVVEGEYRTGHQEQLYIETNGVIAVPDGDGMTVYGSMQCPVLRAPGADGAARAAGRRACASCRPKPAAGLAARRNTRRTSPATRRCSRARPAGR